MGLDMSLRTILSNIHHLTLTLLIIKTFFSLLTLLAHWPAPHLAEKFPRVEAKIPDSSKGIPDF